MGTDSAESRAETQPCLYKRSPCEPAAAANYSGKIRFLEWIISEFPHSTTLELRKMAPAPQISPWQGKPYYVIERFHLFYVLWYERQKEILRQQEGPNVGKF